jgi:hypothetical protein
MPRQSRQSVLSFPVFICSFNLTEITKLIEMHLPFTKLIEIHINKLNLEKFCRDGINKLTSDAILYDLLVISRL